MNTRILPIAPEYPVLVAQVPDFVSARILEIEIGQPLPDVSNFDEKTGEHYHRAVCLVRLHSQPLGVVELQLEEHGVRADMYAPCIWHSFATEINKHLRQDGLPPASGLDAMGLSSPTTPGCLKEREQFLARAPFVSVIVPTHDRPEQIRHCLQSLMDLQYLQYEIIVVDNTPSTSATADFIRQTYHDVPKVRYIREDYPSASRARNRGMMEAQGEILAFTDDDVIVDRYWLLELVRGFSRTDDVACVTGLIMPLELETQAQVRLEEYGGYSKGFTRLIFDMEENRLKTPLYPYTAGQFGTGANMAFKTATLRSLGGFDLALGPASLARGGEDLAAFFQVVTQGHKLVYEPAALLYHPHCRDYMALRKQIYNYGIGLVAYLTKSVFDNPRLLFNLIPKLPYGLVFILSTHSSKNSKKSKLYPKELTNAELKGMLYGPFAYMRSRWAIRKVR